MDLEFLKCSICPKKPTFSDTSHLLTHVGSKGHLSNLHKLEVRAHQEIVAGVELASYNQWYQQYGLAQLLSERLLQKESKQAGKRRAAAKRGACVTQQSSAPRTVVTQPIAPRRTAKVRNQGQRKSTRGRQTAEFDDDSDLDFSPVKRSRRRPRRPHLPSPVKRAPSSDGIHSSDEDCPAEEDQATVLVTPEHAKLKGTVWPGMDLFDAATEEMKRVRNQKKDGSVLRRMEKLAALVEPTEVVYSPGGNVKKARHIDDLEDASSLIDGESPLPKLKQPRARKRQPLAERDTNAPRLVKRKAKIDAPKAHTELSFAHTLPPLPYLPSSSTGDSIGLGSRYLPTEDDDDDFKPPLEVFAPRKRQVQFTILGDGSPNYGSNLSMEEGRNPLQAALPVYGNTSLQQVPKASASWLQPHYQSALQYTNPYTSYRPVAREYQGYYEAGIGNENVAPLADPPSSFRLASSNPLSWRSPVRPSTSSRLLPDSPFGNLFGLFAGGGQSDDPFVTANNPLAEALEHLEGDKEPVTVKERPRSPVGMGSSDETET